MAEGGGARRNVIETPATRVLIRCYAMGRGRKQEMLAVISNAKGDCGDDFRDTPEMDFY